MEFVAVDVETANADLSSICQIGVVRFIDGEVGERWQTLVDPADEFDGINVAIHGLDSTAVRGAPTFDQVAHRLAGMLNGHVVVSHMAFDRVSLGRAYQKHGLPVPECRWLDSAKVSRRAWTQFAERGYGLASVAAHCGIEFRHHEAVEDAYAAGQILLRAVSETRIDIDGWVHRVELPIGATGTQLTRSGNPDGELFGEVVVFTGTLSMPRREAADLAARAGCAVAASVGKSVTLLVVGDQDIQKLGGKAKSAKHLKAEQAISNGQAIRILTERDFKATIGLGA